MIYKYAHPEFFSDWEKPDLESLNGEIILYGAGRRGSVAAHCLKNRRIDFICFCDSDEKKQGIPFCGHDVISPEELKRRYKDITILITTNHYYYIEQQLKKDGFTRVFSCVSLFLEIDFIGYDLYSPEYMYRNIDNYYYTLISSNKNISYLTQIQIPVTMRCTLRCRECNSYIPYIKKGEDFDAEQIIQAVNKLLTAYKAIGNILLYGGEPLLYGDLHKLVSVFSSDEHIEQVSVVSNGTLLPDEQLLKTMMDPKVVVRISDYGSLSRKKAELLELLGKNNIRTELTDFKFWNRQPTVEILNETEEQLRKKVFNCCTIADSNTLINGKLFFCSYSAYHHYLRAVPDFGDNYVDLFATQEEGAQLREKIEKIRQMGKDGLPKQACRFCNFNNFADNLPVAEQTTELMHFQKVY